MFKTSLISRQNIILLNHLRPFSRLDLSHMSKRERKWMKQSQYDLKDMTKDQQFRKSLQDRRTIFRKQQPFQPISELS